MTQAAEPNLARINPVEVRQQLNGKHVCPFCGVIRADQTQPCPRCTMEDTTGTRSATRQRIGPWFVLQARNPSAPGMRFATLLSLAGKGHVTPRSIVRGPTTHQLWTFAARVRGLSREFGLCSHCGETIEPTAAKCRHCDRSQEPPADPDTLLEAGASTAPEMMVTAAATSETGMDGGTSLDLQLDEGFGVSVTRPTRPAAPSVASKAPVSVTSSLSASPAPAPQPTSAPTSPSGSSSRALAPLRPQAQTEEAILTARELAAAFQLEFKQVPGSGPARNLPAAPRGANPTPIRPSTERESRGGVFKTIAALLLIAVIAAAIVMGLRPDLRERSVVWLNETWTSIKSSLDAPATKPAVPTNNAAPSVKSPKPPVKPAPVETKAPPVAPPSPVIPPAPKPEPPPAVPVEPKVETPKPPAPKPEPVTPPPAPKPAPAVAIDPNLTIEQATELAKDLRNRGIDAEATRDWAGAVRIYEQIEKLPRDAWPADLQMRLEMVRSRLK